MSAPPICLYCARLFDRRERPDGVACPSCGQRPPEGTWVSEDGRTAFGRVAQPVMLTALAVLLFVLAAKIMARAAQAQTGSVFALFQVGLLLGGLVLAGVSAVLVRTAARIALERRLRFTSSDGRVDGRVRLFAGAVRWATCSCYPIHRLDLGDAPGARVLTSASVLTLQRELRVALHPHPSLLLWNFVSDDAVVAVAAILGLAARGEVDVVVGRASGFTFDAGRVQTFKQGQVRLWLYAPAELAAGPPFEGRLVEHARALTSARHPAPTREAKAAGYRARPPREGEGEEVQLSLVLDRFVASSMISSQAMLNLLREPGPPGDATADDVVAGFVAAAKVEPETTRALAIALYAALSAPPTVRLDQGLLRDLLVSAGKSGELPAPLRPLPPRPDVFSGKGYLRQAKYRARYLPLLTSGRVAHGICVSRRASQDSEGVDVSFEYAWLDHEGKIRRAKVKESYDPMHAGLSAGVGSIVVDMDASMEKGRVLTVVYAGDEHVVYEALNID